MRRALALLWLALVGCRDVIGGGVDPDRVCELEPGAPAGVVCRAMPDSCGCAGEDVCVVDYQNDERVCAPAGTTPHFAPCTDALECEEGSFCRRWNGAPHGFCLPFCVDDGDCEPARSACYASRRAGVTYCEEGCTPGRDEQDCGEGLACAMNADATTSWCRPVGPAGLGDRCDEEYCRRGLACTLFEEGSFCVTTCGPEIGGCDEPAVCAVNLSATSARRVEGPEHGVCLVLN